ncbi:MAG: transcriptional repressor [Bacteroidales bacterium]|jgi:Fur family peroxide stress response transcriptional regulator|nr:transcriptional repressor [Bacteroidales bacterium]
MDAKDFSKELNEKGLKVTPQRIAVLDAIISLNNHPTAENIMDHIRKIHPNISSATIYKVLDVFVSNGLIRRVDTERDIMRYDAITESHHHIYCSDSNRIEDYKDEELHKLLTEYFQKKQIPDFKIEDLKLHIIGKFTGNNT